MSRTRSVCVFLLFPLFLLVILGVLGSVGNSNQLTRRLMQSWGVSKVPAGLDLSEIGRWWTSPASLLPVEDHSHSFDTQIISTPQTGIHLIFAHMADGPILGTNQSFQTSILLLNDFKHLTTGTIRFFDDSGNPLEVTLNGEEGSSFDFSLNEGQTQEFVTSGTGDLKTGWISVRSEQPIVGAATFGITDARGRVVTDVGVNAAEVGSKFTIFADSIGQSRTVGDTFAHGYLARGSNSRMMRLVATEKVDGILTFETMLDNSEGLFRQGEGSLSSEGDALVLDLMLDGKMPFTEIAEDADQHFFFLPGLISSAEGREEITVQTDFISVSYLPNEDLPILRKTEQRIELQEPDSTLPQIENVSPLFPVPGGTLSLSGRNFSDELIVYFSGPEKSMIATEGDLLESGILLVAVPEGAVDGEIWLESSQGTGNSFRIKFLFNPQFELSILEGDGTGPAQEPGLEEGLSFSVSQEIDQLLITGIQVELVDFGVDLESLAVDQLVGAVTAGRDFSVTEFYLKVTEIEDDSVLLDFVFRTNPDVRVGESLRVEEVPGLKEGSTNLRFTYFSDDSIEEPILLHEGRGFWRDFTFGGFPFIVPDGTRAIVASALIDSAPRGAGGAESKLRVRVGSGVAREEN